MTIPAARTFLFLLTFVACHRTPAFDGTAVGVCVDPVPSPPPGTVRIDGPGAFGPHVGDSGIVVINGRERWRGTFTRCADRPFDLTV